ncbi:MAG: HD domain-containing protein [Cellulosilyticaceae bacterium]
MLYRIKQFWWAMTAVMTDEDKEFVKKYLDEDEVNIFYELQVYEQVHSVKVAKEMERQSAEEDRVEWTRVGLLHDIGKTLYPIGPIRKSIVVMWNRIFPYYDPTRSCLKMFRCYYYHCMYGQVILMTTKEYPKSFLLAIRHHHGEGGFYSEMLDALKKADELF